MNMSLKKFLDFLLPRFVTEDVVFEELICRGRAESWSPACAITDIKPGERYEKIGTIRSFKFMGGSYGIQVIGELLEFKPKS
ncbi:hypothetical protein SOASR029_21100 [Budvicia aquatica]|nr:hypothetical protein SOASR029_21100 [Budvicia aquatica]